MYFRFIIATKLMKNKLKINYSKIFFNPDSKWDSEEIDKIVLKSLPIVEVKSIKVELF